MKAAPEPPAIDPLKPVAYDQYGRPLYAHPPTTQPQVVHMSRAIDPKPQDISPETKEKHEESRRKYPGLNLSEGEYVISAVRRHPIGVFSIWLVVAVALLIVFVAFPALIANQGILGGGFQLSSTLIASAGLDPASVRPPDGGRAPGWAAGIAAAQRERVHRLDVCGLPKPMLGHTS